MSIEPLKGISEMEFALEALVTAYKGIIPGGIGSDERSLMKQAITALRQAIKQAENNQFKPDWDAMTVMVEEQQRMASQIATTTHVLKTVNSAAMKLTSDLCRMEVDDDDRVSRDRVMERVVQWRNEWDNAMSNNTSTPIYTAPPKPWVGLTDAEIFDVIRSLCADNETAEMLIDISMDEYRAIEAKLKEKNN